jgi:phosphopantetheine adenylyltransferase
MKFDTIFENLIAKFKPSKGETVAILPGGFKPPHKGHFKALSYLLDEADRGIVFIGKKEREGANISAEQSKRIWEIYKKHLQKPVEIIIADKTPVISMYEYVDKNLDKNIIVGAGPEDENRFSYFQKNINKYPLVKIVNIPPMHNRISGTRVRQLIGQKDSNAVDYFAPTITQGSKEVSILTPNEKNSIKSILKI